MIGHTHTQCPVHLPEEGNVDRLIMNGRFPGMTSWRALYVVRSCIRPQRLWTSSSAYPGACVALSARVCMESLPKPREGKQHQVMRLGSLQVKEPHAIVYGIRRRIDVCFRKIGDTKSIDNSCIRFSCIIRRCTDGGITSPVRRYIISAR